MNQQCQCASVFFASTPPFHCIFTNSVINYFLTQKVNSMNLNKVQDTIITEFDMVIDSISNRLRYFRHLAGLGNSVSMREKAAIRSGEKLVEKTRSRIWLDARYHQGKVYYAADSDNRIMNGILSLYVRVFSGKTPQEIIDSHLYFLSEIRLYHFLPPLRLKELSAVLQGMRRQALAFQVQALQAG